jgi:hypothetical protein
MLRMMITAKCSAWRLVNISGTLKTIDLKGERYGYLCLNERVFSSANTTMVAEIGPKGVSQGSALRLLCLTIGPALPRHRISKNKLSSDLLPGFGLRKPWPIQKTGNL